MTPLGILCVLLLHKMSAPTYLPLADATLLLTTFWGVSQCPRNVPVWFNRSVLPFLLLGFVLPPLAVQPYVQITDPANQATLNGGPSGFIGASFTDFDSDGDLDLFVGHQSLNRNDGNVSFSLLNSGIGDIIAGANGGNSWADYDNDSDLDVFIASSSSALNRNDHKGTYPGNWRVHWQK